MLQPRWTQQGGGGAAGNLAPEAEGTDGGGGGADGRPRTPASPQPALLLQQGGEKAVQQGLGQGYAQPTQCKAAAFSTQGHAGWQEQATKIHTPTLRASSSFLQGCSMLRSGACTVAGTCYEYSSTCNNLQFSVELQHVPLRCTFRANSAAERKQVL